MTRPPVQSPYWKVSAQALLQATISRRGFEEGFSKFPCVYLKLFDCHRVQRVRNITRPRGERRRNVVFPINHPLRVSGRDGYSARALHRTCDYVRRGEQDVRQIVIVSTSESLHQADGRIVGLGICIQYQRQGRSLLVLVMESELPDRVEAKIVHDFLAPSISSRHCRSGS